MTPEHKAIQRHINQQIYASSGAGQMPRSLEDFMKIGKSDHPYELKMAQSQLDRSIEDHNNGNYFRAHRGLEQASDYLQIHMRNMAESRGHDNILDQVDVDIQPNSYKYAYLS